jgi:hypothetical protein
MSVHGSFTREEFLQPNPLLTNARPQNQAQAQLGIGPESALALYLRTTVFTGGIPTQTRPTATFFQSFGNTTTSSFTSGSIQVTITATDSTWNTVFVAKPFLARNVPHNFSASLRADTFAPNGFKATSDLGNTAVITLTLPQGYSFTSASGSFLTQIPEPASASLLLASGLLTLTLNRKKQIRTQNS